MKRRPLLHKLPSTIASAWPVILFSALGLVFVIFILWFRLDSLVPGVSASEANYLEQISANELNFREIITNQPVFMPYFLGLYILQIFNLNSVLALRSIGAFFGLLSIAAVFFIVHRWHTLRVSVITTILYATSAGLLHVSRLGAESTIYLLLPVAFAAGLYVRKLDNSWLKLLLYGLILASLLYIPGGVWLIALLVLWQRKRLFQYISSLGVMPMAGIASFTLLITGLLVFAFLLDPSHILPWLGLTNNIPTPGVYGMNILDSVSNLLIRGPDNPQMWVGVAPILDAFIVVLFLLGSYVAFTQRKLERNKVLFTSLLVLLLLSGFSSSLSSYIMLPLIYIIAASGLALLLQQWFTVFPINPFARFIGLAVIISVSSLSLVYNMHHYFEVWPKTPAVQAEFQQREE